MALWEEPGTAPPATHVTTGAAPELTCSMNVEGCRCAVPVPGRPTSTPASVIDAVSGTLRELAELLSRPGDRAELLEVADCLRDFAAELPAADREVRHG